MKTPYLLHVEKVEKLILYPDPDLDHAQNLGDSCPPNQFHENRSRTFE